MTNRAATKVIDAMSYALYVCIVGIFGCIVFDKPVPAEVYGITTGFAVGLPSILAKTSPHGEGEKPPTSGE